MAKKYKFDDNQPVESIVADKSSPYGLKTYISLFSSAGVGCYGFKQAGFHCIATAELLERRLNVQKHNNKCCYESGYICGDMTQQETKDKIFRELEMWRQFYGVKDLDVLIATPPCQGMSVANHKKGDELKRNSLVIESITMTKAIKPLYFVFENVKAFLTSKCTDIDGQDKPIRDAINTNLASDYNILFRVVNFKEYGCPSSRTRTLVIGVRKDLQEETPFDVFPDKQPERTLREVIGHLPSLKTMGEISPDDIYHNFRRYEPRMRAWIEKIHEGQSAFDNVDALRIPHSIKDGVIIYNAQKNGDKYTRQCWDKVAPCIPKSDSQFESFDEGKGKRFDMKYIPSINLMAVKYFLPMVDGFVDGYYKVNSMSFKTVKEANPDGTEKENMYLHLSLGDFIKLGEERVFFYRVKLTAGQLHSISKIENDYLL